MSVDASEANRDDGCEWYFGVPFPSKRKAAETPMARAGDKVRVTKLGNLYCGSNHGADVGDVLTVLSADSDSVFTGDWFLWKGEFELLPPTFPPRTRVRVVRNTNRYAVGDTGTVTVSSDESVGVRMDDSRYWSFKPEELVVAPSPWGVEPAPDCAGRNGEQGGHWSYRGKHVFGTKPDGWPDNSFLAFSGPAANDPATPCIVIRQVDGQPRPSSWPHIHQSAADATKEAERLASVNPGKQFDVYQRVTGRVAEQHIEMKVA